MLIVRCAPRDPPRESYQRARSRKNASDLTDTEEAYGPGFRKRLFSRSPANARRRRLALERDDVVGDNATSRRVRERFVTATRETTVKNDAQFGSLDGVCGSRETRIALKSTRGRLDKRISSHLVRVQSRCWIFARVPTREADNKSGSEKCTEHVPESDRNFFPGHADAIAYTEQVQENREEIHTVRAVRNFVEKIVEGLVDNVDDTSIDRPYDNPDCKYIGM